MPVNPAHLWRKDAAPPKQISSRIVALELAMITAPTAKALQLLYKLEKLRAVQAKGRAKA